jgi:transcriptional regulator with XRE-family HTH domain
VHEPVAARKGGDSAMGVHPGFGDFLRRYRAAAGLSQAELAEKAGLSTRGIADLERGARNAPFPQTIRRLVEALELGDHQRALLLAAGARPVRQAKERGAFERLDPPSQRAIPLPFTPLVGRELECAAISARLADQPVAAADLVEKVVRASNQFLHARGLDRLFARRIFNELVARELTEVAAEGRVFLTRGDSPLARFYQLTMQQLSSRLATEGEMSESEIDRYCECIVNPSYLYMWPMMLATWGRKAHA